MVGEKFPKGLFIVPVVDGAKEILEARPVSNDGFWDWPDGVPSAQIDGGRRFSFRHDTTGLQCSVSILVAKDGTQVLRTQDLIEVDRVHDGDGDNPRLTIRYRMRA
jgi:hypothetical protein